MAATRADTLTGAKRNLEFFSDFLDSFAKTPVGDQLGRVVNEHAVNQSLRNLIKTNLGERLFQPYIGSDVYASLFEPNDVVLANRLQFNIETTIKNNEPRVHLLKVEVNSTAKPSINLSNKIYDEHYLQVSITYALINNPTPITLTVFLKRVR